MARRRGRRTPPVSVVLDDDGTIPLIGGPCHGERLWPDQAGHGPWVVRLPPGRRPRRTVAFYRLDTLSVPDTRCGCRCFRVFVFDHAGPLPSP